MSTAELLNDFLKGMTIEAVEANGGDREGTFVMRVREPAPEGKQGKVWYVRFFGTDMGYWFETRRGAKGQWQPMGKEKR